MAYFQRTQDETYDDGFDELNEEEEEEPEDYGEEESEEELESLRKHRVRLVFGAGNLAAILAGTVVILLLVALLLSMINFIRTDINRNFSLLQIKF